MLVKADKIALGKRLEQLAATLNAREPSADQLEGWFYALKECRIEEVLGAMDYAMRHAEKMPTPGSILKRVEAGRVERADAEHRRRVREEAETAARTFAPSAQGAEQLQRLLARLTHRPALEPKAWAERLRHKARAGHYVPIACQQGAARALGVSLAEFQGRAEAAPGAPVPGSTPAGPWPTQAPQPMGPTPASAETDDEREARLEREALMAEGA